MTIHRIVEETVEDAPVKWLGIGATAATDRTTDQPEAQGMTLTQQQIEALAEGEFATYGEEVAIRNRGTGESDYLMSAEVLRELARRLRDQESAARLANYGRDR